MRAANFTLTPKRSGINACNKPCDRGPGSIETVTSPAKIALIAVDYGTGGRVQSQSVEGSSFQLASIVRLSGHIY